MKRIFALILVFLLSSISNAEQRITLEAKANEYKAVDLSVSGIDATFTVSMKLTNYAPNSKWPPAAYAGFYQGKDRDNSIQFLIIRNKPDDKYIVVGYRIIEKGKVAQVRSLANLKLGSEVVAQLSITNGLVTISLQGYPSVNVQTKLGVIKSYLSVSSATAEYKVGT